MQSSLGMNRLPQRSDMPNRLAPLGCASRLRNGGNCNGRRVRVFGADHVHGHAGLVRLKVFGQDRDDSGDRTKSRNQSGPGRDGRRQASGCEIRRRSESTGTRSEQICSGRGQRHRPDGCRQSAGEVLFPSAGGSVQYSEQRRGGAGEFEEKKGLPTALESADKFVLFAGMSSKKRKMRCR